MFGIAEAVLFFARRYAMASAALGLETDVRQELFGSPAAAARGVSRSMAVGSVALTRDY